MTDTKNPTVIMMNTLLRITNTPAMPRIAITPTALLTNRTNPATNR